MDNYPMELLGDFENFMNSSEFSGMEEKSIKQTVLVWFQLWKIRVNYMYTVFILT